MYIHIYNILQNAKQLSQKVREIGDFFGKFAKNRGASVSIVLNFVIDIHISMIFTLRGGVEITHTFGRRWEICKRLK